MGIASRAEPAAAFSRASELVVALGLGAAGAVIAFFASLYGAKFAFLAAAAIPVAVAVVLRPRWGVVLFFFCIAFLEEFPGGLSDQDAERSARQPFYSATFGLPMTYPVDVIVAGLLALYALKKIFGREPLDLPFDTIGAALSMLAVTMALSILIAFGGDYPLGPPILDLSLLGKITLPDAAARYIAVLQIKIYALIFASYVLGLLYFRAERDIRDMVRALGLAMLAVVALLSWRLIRDPTMATRLIAVVYDTASVTFMALAVFFVISKWACGHYRAAQSVVLAVFCVALAVLILLSFRRTLYGALALSTLLLPLLVPARGRARLVMLMAVGACILGAAVAVVPAGQALLQSVAARTMETTLDDSSTLYRFSLLVWVVERFGELPLFGWGIKPLWNETVHIRFFTATMENVHSLYFWILVRFGIVGIMAGAIAVVLVLKRIFEVWRRVSGDEHRILLAMVFLSIVIYLFSGIFNPVYGSARLTISLGLALALVTRLPEIAAAGRAPAFP